MMFCFFFEPTGLCLCIPSAAVFNDAARTVRGITAAHWAACVWPRCHDVLQTVLCSALPEKFTCLGSSIFTPAAACREREREYK